MNASNPTELTAALSEPRRGDASRAPQQGRASSAAPQLLIEGDTCWRRVHAARAAVLIDAASYFAALRASLLEAERSVIILGWELHSRTRIEGDSRPTDGAPVELGPLLRWLLKRRRQLTVRVLLWNHPVFYAVNRELFPRWIFGRKTPERAEIRLDSHLPVGASHHEKLVVIDDEVAYCGGVDLTVRRWDIPAHHPAEPRRRDPARRAYVPLHDVQLVVDGDAARAIGERVRTRWEHAGGEPLERSLLLESGSAKAWPRHVRPDFQDVTVGIMRTVAALEERDRDIREIERATVAAIGSARRLVYIENQYLTAKSACEALVARMREEPKLEVIAVTTLEPGGPLEAETMGVGRQQFMAHFAEPSLAHRIRFVAPLSRCHTPPDDESKKIAADGTLSIHVHAKVLVIDDTFLRIGSSNLNNRSMGFDTECDLGIEAENTAHRRAIASVRNRLIAEHWGSKEDIVAEALDTNLPALKALESLPRFPVFSTAYGARRKPFQAWRRAARAPAYRSVRPIPRDDAAGIDLVVQLGDPERVVSAEELVAQATGVRDLRALKWVLAAVLAAALAGLAWYALSRLGVGMDDIAARVGGSIESLAGSPWRVPLVLVVFVLASVVSVPILALIGATVVTLGPILGFACSAAGTMLAASATFGVGRAIGRKPMKRWLGSKLDALERRVANRGVITIALIRKVPIAPFTLVNMVIGALGIRFRDFLLGTALGMLPGIAAFAFVSDRAVYAWRDPTPENIAAIGGAVVLWLGIIFGIQWLLNRRGTQ